MAIAAVAIAGYYALLLGEWLWARACGRRVHTFADSFVNLACGALERALLAVVLGGVFLLYQAIQRRWSLLDVRPDRAVAWVSLFLLIDLTYYWLHRLHHRVSFLWAAHSVHHQSEQLNLTVGLRTAAFQSLFSLPFYLPVVLLGYPAPMFLAAHLAHNSYQLLVHTRLVGRLGPLEALLTTPSHHRVHHGRDSLYRDRNYAAVLIVWDRLFGTFQAERHEPDYGTRHTPASASPVAAILHEWSHLGREAAALPRWRDRLRLWLGPPVTREASTPRPATVALSPRRRWLVAAEFLALMAGGLWLLHNRPGLPLAVVLLLVGLLAWSLHALGVVLDGVRVTRWGLARYLGLAAGVWLAAITHVPGQPQLAQAEDRGADGIDLPPAEAEHRRAGNGMVVGVPAGPQGQRRHHDIVAAGIGMVASKPGADRVAHGIDGEGDLLDGEVPSEPAPQQAMHRPPATGDQRPRGRR